MMFFVGSVVVGAVVVAAILTMILFPPKAFLTIVGARTGVIFSRPVHSLTRTRRPRIAITIDDGIKGHSTGQLMDVATKHNVVLTWFLIGSNCQQHDPHKQLLQHMQSAGHQIANHGWTDTRAATSNLHQLETGINMTDQWLGPTTLYRPGSGFFTTNILKMCTRMGKRVVLGNVYAHDPLTRFVPWFVIWYSVYRAQPGDIIIMHDYANAAVILDGIIRGLKAKYPQVQLVTVDELLDSS